MTKIDLKKTLAHLYSAPANAVVRVEVPPLRYLMIDGEGDPNTSPTYANAVQCLFSVAYALKFAIKAGPSGTDYVVMPLEGLWWADDMSRFDVERKSDWKWTLMILQPDEVTADLVGTTVASVARRKQLPGLDRLRLEVLEEGVCVQTLHVGPFSTEGPTVERVHEVVDARGARTGRHHEIYLSDIRRADPSKWKTIIRQPMRERSARKGA